jgi:hypothetical protein
MPIPLSTLHNASHNIVLVIGSARSIVVVTSTYVLCPYILGTHSVIQPFKL